MRDFTTNNYCDFLWISDLLELKRNSKNTFTTKVEKNNVSKLITLVNVTIFGTIVEIKTIGSKGSLYHVDDGTGVIICKHSEEQFEEAIGLIESEQNDILNQTLRSRQCSEQSTMTDTSADDSIFNDKSMQLEEFDINKKNVLMGLQSIWDDIYESFTNLIGQYNIGDTVLIQGKLYSYFDVNQIYINNIRPITLTEEISRVLTKLEDGYDPIMKVKKLEIGTNAEKRLSGLMTFDHIHHLNARVPFCRDIETPKRKTEILEEDNKVVTPNLKSTITFDTYNNEI